MKPQIDIRMLDQAEAAYRSRRRAADAAGPRTSATELRKMRAAYRRWWSIFRHQEAECLKSSQALDRMLKS